MKILFMVLFSFSTIFALENKKNTIDAIFKHYQDKYRIYSLDDLNKLQSNNPSIFSRNSRDRDPSDLIGNWECISYFSSVGYVPDAYKIANGGNGQVGNGKFFSINATLNLSETDEDPSIISPKSWTISKDGVVNSDAGLSGVYTLIGNTIFFHNDGTEMHDEDDVIDVVFSINRMNASKLSLVESVDNKQVVICELTSS